ncbi:MAG: HAD-IIIA family hydrolase [Planctomycetes bacterium]|nr:HAD-IIIA family hydrolase [Planctomycetota bacterium]
MRQRCERIRMLVIDVDGVLTDGSIIYSERGEEIKAFHVRDGSGLKIWTGLGMKAAILSGRKSEIVIRRAKELGISAVVQGAENKLEGWKRLLMENQIPPEQAAYVGDDLADLPVLKQSGLAVAVADACEEVRAAAHYVTDLPGGRGAVREAVELILKAQNRWTDVTARHA